MHKFNVDGYKGKYELTIPTSLTEITTEYLNSVTKDVEVADDYSLIAICYREKLSNIIMSIRQNKKDIATQVVPLFVKCGKTDNDFTRGITTNTKVLIDGSAIAIGHHVNCTNNELTINNFLTYIEGDDSAYKNALSHTNYCYFVEFKIVPNCDIKGYYKQNTSNVNTQSMFAKKINEE